VYGLDLARGRRAIEAVSANKQEAELLQISYCDPLILLDSVTFLHDGTPIEYYHAVHRGDRSRFEVELVRVSGQKSLEEVMSSQEIDLPSSH
jgi:GntR family transcriptional regulator